MEEKELLEFDVIIVGAGVIGLAIAERVSRRFDNVLLVEKESAFGQHTSSRNSEIIHSGIYYQTGSLKAKLCVKGNSMLYDFMCKHDIDHRMCGKLIVATEEEEIGELESLLQNGKRNGVKGIELISTEEIKKKQPEIKAIKALWVPSTGIMDTHGIMMKLEQLAEENGATISYNTEVCAIEKKQDKYQIRLLDQDYRVQTPVVINSTGLWSADVSNMADIGEYKIQWCKGEYYKTNKYKDMSCLVYPVPNSISLGIHTVIGLDGNLSFGPNAYYVDELNYNFDASHKKQFHEAISRYLDVEYDDLQKNTSGIRPKLQKTLDKPVDYVILKERNKPDFINLVGIESPGFTCCLSIANFIEDLLEE